MARVRRREKKNTATETPQKKYYPKTIAELRERIIAFASQGPIEPCDGGNPPIAPEDVIILLSLRSRQSHDAREAKQRMFGHILWMLDQVEAMPAGKSAKAGRWMGWVFAHLEMLGVITNDDARRLAKADNDEGNG